MTGKGLFRESDRKWRASREASKENRSKDSKSGSTAADTGGSKKGSSFLSIAPTVL